MPTPNKGVRKMRAKRLAEMLADRAAGMTYSAIAWKYDMHPSNVRKQILRAQMTPLAEHVKLPRQ